MTDQNEPSMEDILASIRSILADGEGEPAPAPAVEEKNPPNLPRRSLFIRTNSPPQKNLCRFNNLRKAW